MNTPGFGIGAAPPARAMEHSLLYKERTVRRRATRKEERAVSTVTAGPSRPRVLGEAARGDAAGDTDADAALGAFGDLLDVAACVVVHEAAEDADVFRALDPRHSPARTRPG